MRKRLFQKGNPFLSRQKVAISSSPFIITIYMIFILPTN